MIFDINTIAREYVNKRFVQASSLEKEKIIKDWIEKIDNSNLLVEDFKKRVGDPLGKRIVDVGCGNGGISIAFSMAGAKISGVEVEEDLVLIAKEQASNFGVQPEFYLYDGGILPFPNETFDYAISASVLEHTSDPIFYLNQIFRVLKKGGVLYLGFPNKFWPKETHTGLWFLTYVPSFMRDAYVSFFKKNPLKENNLHFYSYFDLEKMLKKNSLEFNVHIIPEDGKSSSVFKIYIRKILGFFGISHKVLLPHILILVKKND